MQRNKVAGLLLIGAMLLGACSNKGPKYTKYIPKDASYVLSIDVKGMVGKLEKDGLKVEDMMGVLKDSSDPARYSKAMEIWQQFKDAGLDWENKVLIAVPTVNLNSGDLTIEVVVGLKDAKKLEEFISKLPEAPKVQSESGLKYASNKDMTIGWKDDAVMILTAQQNRQYISDENDAPAPAPATNSSLVDKMKKYFGQGKDESVASVKEFGDWISKKSDIGIFTNSSSMAAGQGGLGMAFAMMPKVKELMEGIYSSTSINFEEGKVVADGETYVGKKLGDILAKYNGNEVDMNLLEHYPSNNVNGVLAFSFKPEMISALMKEAGVEPLVDQQISQTGTGITKEDILKALKGDFAVIVSDFTLELKEMTFGDQKYKMPQPDFKMVGAIKIGDKASFDKIVAIGEKMGVFQKQGNRLIIAPQAGGGNVVVGVENNSLIVANKEEVYAAYAAQNAKIGIPDEARSALKGKSASVFVNAESLMKGIPETLFDSTDVHEKKVLGKAKETFKTFYFSAGKFSGNSLSSSGGVTMGSAGNSLSQLVRFLMFTADEFKQKEAERRTAWDKEDALSDTTNISPVH